jgi:hypothetical protein
MNNSVNNIYFYFLRINRHRDLGLVPAIEVEGFSFHEVVSDRRVVADLLQINGNPVDSALKSLA